VPVKSYCTDLSDLEEIKLLEKNISKNHKNIDVLINNADIYKTTSPIKKDGFDVRFIINTIATYFLTKLLIPLFNKDSRVITIKR
jgi:NAD(P)-dependent dehydrogenase (short-subunit alcohol dehydrogenase family)